MNDRRPAAQLGMDDQKYPPHVAASFSITKAPAPICLASSATKASRPRRYCRSSIFYGPHFVGQFPEWIKQNGAHLDYAFLSRAHVSRNYIDGIREYSKAEILYYGHDIPYERLEGEYKLTGKAAIKQEIEYWREAEMEIWQKSDVIYYPAQDEVEAVRQAMPDKTVRPLSIYVYPDNEIEDARLGRERRGPPTVMFVAGFRHRPNVDAALWFVREVLPLVRLRIPELHTILAGSFPPPAVTGLANERVLVTGYIPDTVLDGFTDRRRWRSCRCASAAASRGSWSRRCDLACRSSPRALVRRACPSRRITCRSATRRSSSPSGSSRWSRTRGWRSRGCCAASTTSDANSPTARLRPAWRWTLPNSDRWRAGRAS
jgi:hypothetical protein